MASITAAAGGGNWTTGGSWVGGVAPTAADDALLTSASGNITIDAGAVCRSLDCNTYTGTLTHTSGVNLAIGDGTAGAGNRALRLVSGMTYTLGSATTSTISFISTSATVQTITTGTKVLAAITLNGVAGSWQLADALTLGGVAANTITVTNGTFDSNNQTISCGGFASSNSNTRTITLGSSTITLNGNGATWNFGTITGLTFNPGTSTIVMANGNMSFSGGGTTFNNLTFNGTNGGDFTLNGANTFNNLTYTPLTSGASNIRLVISANQTVTGTFIAQGVDANNYNFVRSSAIGTQRTITAAVVSISNISFTDIVGAGAGTWSGSLIGDMGNNSGITFTSPTTLYWVTTTGGSANSTARWSTSSGGASGARVPLPQDTMTFDANSITSSGRTINMNLQCLGNVDFRNLANSPTITFSISNGQIFVNGNLALGTVTVTNTTTPFLVGRSSQTITSAGASMTGSLDIRAFGGTYTLQDDISLTGTLTLTNGTFDANGKNVTCSIFSSSNSNTRVLTMGSGTWTVTGTGVVWSFATATGLTYNVNTSTVVVSDVSASSKTLTTPSPAAFSTLTITPTGSGAILWTGTAARTITTLNITGPKTMSFSAGGTYTVTNLNILGSAGNLVTMNSTTPGTQWTLSMPSGLYQVRYASIQDSLATGGATFVALNSTNAGNNTNWFFTQNRTSVSGRVAASGRVAVANRSTVSRRYSLQ